VNDVNYRIRLTPNSRPITVHIDRLRRFEGDMPLAWKKWNEKRARTAPGDPPASPLQRHGRSTGCSRTPPHATSGSPSVPAADNANRVKPGVPPHAPVGTPLVPATAVHPDGRPAAGPPVCTRAPVPGPSAHAPAVQAAASTAAAALFAPGRTRRQRARHQPACPGCGG